MTDVIKLIEERETVDSLGVATKTKNERKVYCDIESVSQTEFFAGLDSALKPSRKFIVFFADYRGERLLKCWSDYYTIYRVYRNGDRVELYAEKRIGDGS